jgi:cell division protease FtsH
MKKRNIKKGIMPYVIVGVFVLSVLWLFNMLNTNVHEFTYNEFLETINNGEVTEITITPKETEGIYNISGKLEDYEENESFVIPVPLSEEIVERLLAMQDEHTFEIVTKSDPSGSSILLILINILPILLLIGATFFIMTRQLGGANKSMDFGKSRAKLTNDKNKMTFKDVAGLTEEKEEVSELIDFLKNPKKFQKLGARIPKGVMLVGPPGTGKTLLARAVAGEANVPFYYISGSDFVELFVGVGASRVRDMFKQAKNNAPCLIFIDEIDAVGRQRGTGLGGGHDEREQTLNQLLTEMDGFGANEGIIIIAATNRPDVLDPALLRPGRFDRQVTVGMPDVKAREEILAVHARNKIFSDSVTLKNVAKRTPGFSGADLENLLNEAALLAVRRNKTSITMNEIDEANDRVLMGPAKVTKKYNPKEKKLIAYHEAGHAVIGIKLDNAHDVHKITIVPRGQAGGYNLMLPREETIVSTKRELTETIVGLLGGRVSEEINFDDITTGAHNDFKKATKLARAMVTEYGMSDLGPIQLEHTEGKVFLGRDYNKSRNFSDKVAHEIDLEVRKIISECYKTAEEILRKNQKLVDLISNSLLEHETLTKEEIDYLVENGKMPESSDGRNDHLIDLPVSKLKEMAKEKGIKGYTKMTKQELVDELK